jgi:hypothetical protein
LKKKSVAKRLMKIFDKRKIIDIAKCAYLSWLFCNVWNWKNTEKHLNSVVVLR